MFKSSMADVTGKDKQTEQSEQQVKPTKKMTKSSFKEEKAKIIAMRREEYDAAVKTYGNDPKAHNYLILLECRLKSAEEISNEFQLMQQQLLPKLTMG